MSFKSSFHHGAQQRKFLLLDTENSSLFLTGSQLHNASWAGASSLYSPIGLRGPRLNFLLVPASSHIPEGNNRKYNPALELAALLYYWPLWGYGADGRTDSTPELEAGGHPLGPSKGTPLGCKSDFGLSLLILEPRSTSKICIV